MIYKALAESLRSIADQAEVYFRTERGIRGFKAEAPIHHDVACPTLQAQTRDFHILCVEASETPYPNTLDRLVLDCVRLGLPVKLYMAVPKPANAAPEGYVAQIARAKDVGVGLVEVDGRRVKLLHDALSLSLAGLRQTDRRRFPQKYREGLLQAESTFRNGNPSKGCSEIYDELEGLCRRLATKAQTKGLCSLPTGMNVKKDPWASVLEALIKSLDYSKTPISKQLLTRILGITGHRNESNHRPASRATLVQRDSQLRTRFETAADLLLELAIAAKSLRV